MEEEKEKEEMKENNCKKPIRYKLSKISHERSLARRNLKINLFIGFKNFVKFRIE